ncbi:BA75_01442T0 [Komagataella pastoris]|uniref:BA75_01442T0 n=1 Tax=Komagataella pastoris TaxID=4922 RepID=A0A1B2J991_PICPA|nr:BA75_01442T0 [Komagataella pastoris]
MFSTTTVSVHFDPLYKKQVYSSGDIIKGTVQLNVPKDISLKGIDVKLEGISEASARFRKRQTHETNKYIRITETHRFLFHDDRVFPPRNIQAVTKATEFDLIAGEYSYPFEFTLPDTSNCFRKPLTELTDNYGRECRGHYYGYVSHKDCYLPPSFNYRDATIKYFIKVTARRTALLKSNLRQIVPFVFLPDDSLLTRGVPTGAPVFAQNRIDFPKKRVGQIFHKSGGVQTRKECSTGTTRRKRSIFGFGKGSDDADFPLHPLHIGCDIVLVNGATLTPGHPIDLQITLSSSDPSQFYMDNGETNLLGRICLTNFEVELARTTYYSVGRRQIDHVEKVRVFASKELNLWLDMAHALPVSDNESQLRIPTHFLDSVIVPNHLPPTFFTCNIYTNYSLIITAHFGDSDHRPKRISTTFRVTLLSGIDRRTQQSPPQAVSPVETPPVPSKEAKTSAPAPVYTPQEPEQLPSYQSALNEAATGTNGQSNHS